MSVSSVSEHFLESSKFSAVRKKHKRFKTSKSTSQSINQPINRSIDQVSIYAAKDSRYNFLTNSSFPTLHRFEEQLLLCVELGLAIKKMSLQTKEKNGNDLFFSDIGAQQNTTAAPHRVIQCLYKKRIYYSAMKK